MFVGDSVIMNYHIYMFLTAGNKLVPPQVAKHHRSPRRALRGPHEGSQWWHPYEGRQAPEARHRGPHEGDAPI